MNVFVVEDDERITAFLAKGLREEGHVVSVATTGAEALALLPALQEDLDVALLDLGLPDRDGREVLVALRRARPELAVIVLTARSDVREKVRVLDAGAADYVTKPFAFEELLARMRAAVRSRSQPTSHQLVVGDLT
ncbi:MAG: response regulator, partial [Mycobacteriales bacterium]